MDVFELRRRLVDDYERYIRSFISIRDDRIRDEVDSNLAAACSGPSRASASTRRSSRAAGSTTWSTTAVSTPSARRSSGSSRTTAPSGRSRFHRHQVEAIEAARSGANYVLTTGTGSGKSLAYIVPIVDHVLRSGSRRGIQAIVVYPMNALANSQVGELEKFLRRGYPTGGEPVTFRRYTGQENDEERNEIIANPPDILLTNYVMLELILTRADERPLVEAAEGLQFLVLDELHTYRGRQGADVALLVRRVREACKATELQFVGTSATLATGGTFDEQQAEVAAVASPLFGRRSSPANVIGETLRRSTPAFDRPTTDLVAGVWPRGSHGRARRHPRHDGVRRRPAVALDRDDVRGRRGAGDRPARAGHAALDHRRAAAPPPTSPSSTGLAADRCAAAIERQLLAGNERHAARTASRSSPSGSTSSSAAATPSTPRSSPRPSATSRCNPQPFVPGQTASKLLLPLVFCRECGQEYYSVVIPEDDGLRSFEPKPIDFRDEVRGEPGFLYLSSTRPVARRRSTRSSSAFPTTGSRKAAARRPAVKRDQRKRLPAAASRSSHARRRSTTGGHRAWFVPARSASACAAASPTAAASVPSFASCRRSAPAAAARRPPSCPCRPSATCRHDDDARRRRPASC